MDGVCDELGEGDSAVGTAIATGISISGYCSGTKIGVCKLTISIIALLPLVNCGEMVKHVCRASGGRGIFYKRKFLR